jgi:hypothetical protein
MANNLDFMWTHTANKYSMWCIQLTTAQASVKDEAPSALRQHLQKFIHLNLLSRQLHLADL